MQLQSTSNSRINRAGLPIGSIAPNFSVQGLELEAVSSAEMVGSEYLIVFSDPNCGPCNHLLPALLSLARRAPQANIMVISRGDLAVNRAELESYHARFRVGLQKHWEISTAFQTYATPSAFLVDEHGIVSAPLAVGAEAILDLLRAAAIRIILREL